MRYEYKVVPAPAKGQKARGVKTAEGRFALSVEQLLNQLGADGWEYQRADMLPSEERAGLTGSTTNWRNLLIFRRVLEETPVGAPARPEPVIEAGIEAGAGSVAGAAPVAGGLRAVKAPEARFEGAPERGAPEPGGRRRNPPEVQEGAETRPDEAPDDGLTGIERALRHSGSTGPD